MAHKSNRFKEFIVYRTIRKGLLFPESETGLPPRCAFTSRFLI